MNQQWLVNRIKNFADTLQLSGTVLMVEGMCLYAAERLSLCIAFDLGA